MKLNEQDDGLGGKAEQWQPEEKKIPKAFLRLRYFYQKVIQGRVWFRAILRKTDQWPIYHHGEGTDQKQENTPGNGIFDELALGEITGAVGDNGRGTANDQHDKRCRHWCQKCDRLGRHIHHIRHR